MFQVLAARRWQPKDRRIRAGRLELRLSLEELETRTVPSITPLSSFLGDPAARGVTNPTPVGYQPSQIRHAYGIDNIRWNGTGQTIAIVDAYDHPNIFSDLDHFDQTFSINGTQTLYDQYGPSSSVLTKVTPQGKPKTNGNWAGEISLDVEWAHAIAPGAHILLVEALTNSYANLLAAVDYAASQPGVVAISMSWGSNEFSWETSYDSHFATPLGHIGGSGLPGGITFLAASGDRGAPPAWPAASPQVVAVGGTTLTTADAAGTYAGEVGWARSGGGISAYESKPDYQSGITQGGSQRTNPDVAYNADYNTGFAVYDTVPYYGKTGWFKAGGTSAGAPQWAALVALADQGRASLYGQGSLDGVSQTLPTLYDLYYAGGTTYTSNFHDIVSGNNGYAAGPGYDLVTGLGSPYAGQVVQQLVIDITISTAAPAVGDGQSSTHGPANPGANAHLLSPQFRASESVFVLSGLPAQSTPVRIAMAGSLAEPSQLSSVTVTVVVDRVAEKPNDPDLEPPPARASGEQRSGHWLDAFLPMWDVRADGSGGWLNREAPARPADGNSPSAASSNRVIAFAVPPTTPRERQIIQAGVAAERRSPTTVAETPRVWSWVGGAESAELPIGAAAAVAATTLCGTAFAIRPEPEQQARWGRELGLARGHME